MPFPFFVVAWHGHTDESRIAALHFDLARRALGWKLEYCADLMEITVSTLSRQLAGKEHLSYWRLKKLGPEFKKKLREIEAESEGALYLERGPLLQLIDHLRELTEHKRMARMELPVSRHKEIA